MAVLTTLLMSVHPSVCVCRLQVDCVQYAAATDKPPPPATAAAAAAADKADNVLSEVMSRDELILLLRQVLSHNVDEFNLSAPSSSPAVDECDLLPTHTDAATTTTTLTVAADNGGGGCDGDQHKPQFVLNAQPFLASSSPSLSNSCSSIPTDVRGENVALVLLPCDEMHICWQISFAGRFRGRNQLCQILSKSVQGFQFCGGQILAFPIGTMCRCYTTQLDLPFSM